MARFFLLIFVALFIVQYSMAKPSGRRNRHRLNDDEIEKIRKRCKDDPTLCKGQKEEHKKKRQDIKHAILNRLKAGGRSDVHAEKEAEEQLQKIHELKVKIHEAMGIEDVEPADDGLFGGDMLLTKEQAQRKIDHLQQDTESKSKRAAATFFEAEPDSKWPSFPIHYWINGSAGFSDKDKATIRDALLTLSWTSGTTFCLSFVEDAAPAAFNRNIVYVINDTMTADAERRMDPSLTVILLTDPAEIAAKIAAVSQIQFTRSIPDTGCHAIGGYLGLQVNGKIIGFPNQVNLGYGCVDYKNIVMHETIHALGGGHEHQRTDRDKYISVLWDNVDPQKIDAFYIDSYSTSYGMPYRTTSIMHYQSNAFAVKKGLFTIINKATNAADIGDNLVLTPEDIQQLNLMYCTATNPCNDSSISCGDDAIAGKCANSDTQSKCPRSCNRCGKTTYG